MYSLAIATSHLPKYCFKYLKDSVGEPARGREVWNDPHGVAKSRGGVGGCCHVQSELLNVCRLDEESGMVE